MFQVAVIAAVAADITQINASGASGAGNGTNHLNHGESHGHPRECSYKDFTNGKPKTFHESGGVITLIQWFEKTESVFEICVCPETSKVKYVTSTFSDRALTWWKGHVKALTLLVENSMSWVYLKILMLEGYCSRGEVEKLEHEIWTLKMVRSDLVVTRPYLVI